MYRRAQFWMQAASTGQGPAAAAVKGWSLVEPYKWRSVVSDAPKAQEYVRSGTYFYGDRLGRRPLVVLPGILSGSPTIPTTATVKTVLDPFLAKANLSHGALMVPHSLTTPTPDPTRAVPTLDPKGQNYFTSQCDAIAAVLDYHHISWAHFLCYSSGALLAMRMALMYPHKVGSIMLIDSPVITAKMLSNSARRAELACAQLDVNIDRDLISSLAESVTADPRDGPFPEPYSKNSEVLDLAGKPCVNHATTLNDKLFGAHTYSANGLHRSIDGYTHDVKDLLLVRHPMWAVGPAGFAGAMDIDCHSNELNLRRKLAVKEAPDHASLFTVPAALDAVGKAMTQWISRWEMDDIIAKKLQNAKRDALPSVAQQQQASGEGAAKPEGKKGEGKKKKDKK
jgi:pimeloyl-ACP methyl ester carboxylesterase